MDCCYFLFFMYIFPFEKEKTVSEIQPNVAIQWYNNITNYFVS